MLQLDAISRLCITRISCLHFVVMSRHSRIRPPLIRDRSKFNAARFPSLFLSNSLALPPSTHVRSLLRQWPYNI